MGKEGDWIISKPTRAGGGIVTFIATLGPVGWSPIAPGTAGSAAAALIWWFALKDLSLPVYLLVLAFTTIIAIYSAGVAEKRLGKDAGSIVIDEVVGQFLTLAMCPHEIIYVVAGFLLFRLFDIWKPLFIKKAEKIPSGLGVVFDDVLAGAVGFIALYLIVYLTNL